MATAPLDILDPAYVNVAKLQRTSSSQVDSSQMSGQIRPEEKREELVKKCQIPNDRVIRRNVSRRANSGGDAEAQELTRGSARDGVDQFKKLSGQL